MRPEKEVAWERMEMGRCTRRNRVQDETRGLKVRQEKGLPRTRETEGETSALVTEAFGDFGRGRSSELISVWRFSKCSPGWVTIQPITQVASTVKSLCMRGNNVLNYHRNGQRLPSRGIAVGLGPGAKLPLTLLRFSQWAYFIYLFSVSGVGRSPKPHSC